MKPDLELRIQKNTSRLSDNVLLALVGLVAGVALSQLALIGIGPLLIGILGCALILFVLYRQGHTNAKLTNLLWEVFSTRGTMVKYYNEPSTFYNAGAAVILSARDEVLMYNDYFGEPTLSMGFSTTAAYYKSIEDLVQKRVQDKDFRYCCVIGAESFKGANLSPEYERHLKYLFNIVSKHHAEDRIKPFLILNQRLIYVSFTIVDSRILRLCIDGVNPAGSSSVSLTQGGFIIRNDSNLCNDFYHFFRNLERQAIPLDSIESIEKYLGIKKTK